MGGILNMIWLWIFGLAPIVLSIVLGFYWLKNERLPWEKRRTNNNSEKHHGH